MGSEFLQRSRQGTRLYFRRRVPDDLIGVIGKRQIYRSLETNDRALALRRARFVAVQSDQFFDAVRSMKKKHPAVEPLKVDYEFKLDFDLAAGKASVQVKADPSIPGDSEQAQQALQAGLAGFQGVAAALKASGADETKTASLSPDLLLGPAIDDFLSRANLRATTKKAHSTGLRNVALPHFGKDRHLAEITQRDFAKFVDTVAELDCARSTKEGYLSALSKLGSWNRDRGVQIPVWTYGGLLPADDDPDASARDAFSIEQVEVLFSNAARYRAAEPAKFWVTVAVAFMGCRLEELAQVDLRVDLKRSGSVHFVDVNQGLDADGVRRKSLKRDSSKRVIPIHSALIKHGFVKFLHSQLAAGFARPFESAWNPHVFKGSNAVKWSHKTSKWGGSELKRLIRDGRLSSAGKLAYFHSLRHTFATHLAARGVREEERAMLAGQSFGGVNAMTYVKLRSDPGHLSGIVEAHMGAFVEILDRTLSASGPTA